jgi:hypothetical protein
MVSLLKRSELTAAVTGPSAVVDRPNVRQRRTSNLVTIAVAVTQHRKRNAGSDLLRRKANVSDVRPQDPNVARSRRRESKDLRDRCSRRLSG